MNTEQLKALEDFAYNLVPIHIMAVMMEVNEIDLRLAIEQTDSAEHHAYYTGYGKILLETRKQIIRSAQNGSNPAQQEILQFIREFQNDNNSFL